jgi:DNA-binding NarL/FixJ family response regulator
MAFWAWAVDCWEGTLTEAVSPRRVGSAREGQQQHARDRVASTRARSSAVLADASPVARLAMRVALEHDGIAVVGEAADAAEAVRAALTHQPDICLVDARLPGAIPAVRQIATSQRETRVVVLFDSPADETLIEALRAGAAGCLCKETGPAGLRRAVRATLDGEAPLPRAAARRVIEELRLLASERSVRTASGSWTQLSRRESQVLELVRQQLTTAEIAERLGISSVTVRRHVSGTMRRVGARDRDAMLQLTAGHPTARRT